MESYIESIRKQFEYYKSLGEKTMEQLSDEDLFKEVVVGTNSIGIIVNHLAGNMLSRWTNFLEEDGEKEWRNRDREFETVLSNRQEVLEHWKKGWDCLFTALDGLKEADLDRIIYIRNMGHTVVEAINRQLAHYSYHIGQIVFIGKLIQGDEWVSLSIPKGKSATYNKEKFAKPKRNEHFTDDL